MSLRNADGPPYGPNLSTTYVLQRGQWNRKGEPVEPGFPSAIEGHSRPARIDLDPFRRYPTRGRRLALAEWIASPENPLTARVMVNRLWQWHFGRGIVETPSDFGKNGAAPTHPRLLDWLARELVKRNWSLKAMHRLLLTSGAYRQSSLHTRSRRHPARPAKSLPVALPATSIGGRSRPRQHFDGQRQAQRRPRRASRLSSPAPGP